VGALLLLLLAGWGVHSLYLQREQGFRDLVESGLRAINQLQVDSVAQWRQRRMAEAALLSDDTLLGDAVAHWQDQPTAEREEQLRQRLHALLERLQYADVVLVDLRGRQHLGPQGALDGSELPAQELHALQLARERARPVMTGLARSRPYDFPRIGLLVPLYDEHRAVGAVWLVLDARATLYTFLQNWPHVSRSGEALLVERRGGQLVFLSPLRHHDGDPATLALPLQATGNVSVDLALANGGGPGTIEGRDYRGEQVLAVASPVPDSSWIVVSKIDTAEALTGMERRERLALALFTTLALALLGGAALLWQWQARRRERAFQQDLQQNLLWLEAAQRAAHIGYFAYDPEQRMFAMSTMANAIFGLPPQARMTLRQWISALHPQDRQRTLAEHGAAVEQGSALTVQYRILPLDGAPVRWLETRAETGGDGGASRSRMTGTVQDISERRRAEEQLERYRAALEAQVRIDPLTRLANRLALDERMGQEWARARRAGLPLALLMVDVDHFKAFNDHFGHIAGDRCLQQLAQAMAASAGRASDMVARYGGEEFAVLLPGNDMAQALAVAERLRAAVRALAIDHAPGCGPAVTLSFGVACAHPQELQDAARDGVDAALVLFQQADAALYRAKQLGRDRAVAYGPDCGQALHGAPALAAGAAPAASPR